MLAVAVPAAVALAAAQGPSTPTAADPVARSAPAVEADADAGEQRVVELVRQAASPLRGRPADYDALMAQVGDAEVVLLGEATHGTHEFYRERARITRRLIAEKGFAAIAIEAEWADARRVHRWIAGDGGDATAEAALSGFDRFPRWMWANAEVRDLVAGLRERRTSTGRDAAVGFYGIDMQAPDRAMRAVVEHLGRVDPGAVERARRRYACVAGLGEDVGDYARMQAAATPACRRGLEAQWRDLVGRQDEPGSATEREAAFSAAQSARVVMNARGYFAQDLTAELSSWSLRDRHMADTLEAVRAHLRRQGRPPKVVVWAHNTHVGDARASSLGEEGDWSVGQLMRRRHPRRTVLVGFSTYQGSVVAASDWGQNGRRQPLRPARAGSHAELFHRTGLGAFVLRLPSRGPLAEQLSRPRPERAVGVVYLPATEATSHYLTARLARHFDAVVHIDRTRGLTPLRTP